MRIRLLSNLESTSYKGFIRGWRVYPSKSTSLEYWRELERQVPASSILFSNLIDVEEVP